MMKRKFYKFLTAIIYALLCGAAIQAQAERKSDEKLLAEITALRRKLNQAIEKRDRQALETLFAEDFTHTHAAGRVDGKAKRIEAILIGDKTLESVEPDEIAVRFYGKNTAVAVGQSTIENVIYRWTIVYIKDKKGWRAAASQASQKVQK